MFDFVNADLLLQTQVDSAAGPDGKVHVVFNRTDTPDAMYAVFDGCRWSVATVETDGNVGEGPRIAVDRVGNPHLVYLDRSRSYIRYARPPRT